MRHYHDNAKWLMWFAPFRALSISAGFLTPFFLQHGLSQSQIFLLQSIFSLSFVLWEVPSGWLADRIGRARSIRLSVPFASVSMIAYGFSDQFWQFVICEVLLALANGLISGADKALLIDSLKAEGRGNEYVRITQRIAGFGFAAVALGVPISYLLAKYVGISATIVADGVLTAFGGLFVLRLVEPPLHDTGELDGATVWQSTKRLMSSRECRWLIMLGVVLSSSTYMAAWLAAPFYLSVGLPLELFSAIAAGRSLFKAWLSHRFHSEEHIKQLMAGYVILAGLPYLLMATGQVWLALAVLGHDVVQSLHPAPLSRRYNDYMNSRNRAMLNSVVGMQMRVAFAVLGPLVGLLVDTMGLHSSFVVFGLAFSLAALLPYKRLLSLGTFDRGR